MTGKYLPFLMALVAPFLFGACASPFIEFQGHYWTPDFEFEATIIDDQVSPTGTEIDFVEDLGMPDDDAFGGGRVRLFTGEDSWIRLDYLPLSWEGDRTVTQTIEFAGQTYTVGTRVVSEFDMAYGRFGWGWQFINIGDGVFKLGTLLEAKAFGIEAKLDAPVAGLSESEEIAFGLPTIGLAMDINPVEFVNLYAEGSGITVEHEGDGGTMYDAEAGIRIIPVDWVTITGGYRIVHFDLDIDDNSIDLHLAGPFIGGSIRF